MNSIKSVWKSVSSARVNVRGGAFAYVLAGRSKPGAAWKMPLMM